MKDYNPSILFHSDAVQGFGKYRIYPKRQKIDLLSVSGHKIHGPKGTGFLYIGEKVKIRPILFGGGQQRDIRSGTENVPGIAGLGLAAELAYKDFDIKTALMRELKEYFISEIGQMENTVIHGVADEGSAPHIISLGVAGGTERGSAAYTGGQGNLCIVRISMCFKPSGSQRSIKRNWGSEGIPGCNHPNQYVGVYNKGRD